MTLRAAARSALIVWVALTLLIAIQTLWQGAENSFIKTGPHSILSVTMTSVIFAWMLAGGLLGLIHFGRVNEKNIFTLAGFFLVALLYLNILRERTEYGDIEYYIDAALRLYRGKPLPPEYLYPPFWAWFLKFFAASGEKGLLLVMWTLNVLAVFLFYFLLQRILQTYGFTSRLAALTATAFMLVNMPLLRTLFYGQVNLHVVNLVFLSLLLYPQARPLSALALGLAVHLKIAPVVLALAFLLNRDWRWLIWFGLSLAAVGALPYWTDGLSPYLDFLNNSLLFTAERMTNFRETSIDTLFTVLGSLMNVDFAVTRYGVYAVKVILLGAGLLVMRANVKSGTYYEANEKGALIHNAAPALLLLMTLLSPLVWEHYGVFLTLSFLLLVKRLDSPTEWLTFGFIYFIGFLLPAFDYFPWSFARLAAALILLWMMWKAASKPRPSSAFETANRRLEGLRFKQNGADS
ncbi:MAG: glycosyltransferase family 87 protein [Chloroflexota bacterium]